MINEIWREGGCFCGDIRYRIRGDAVWKAGCTCNTCVRIHGAPYVVMAGFDQSNFGVLQGVPTGFSSSPNVLREFCPKCGSTLTYRKIVHGNPALKEAARLVYVSVVTLDEPDAYPPDEVVHSRERISWLHLPDDIPIRGSISPNAGHLQFGGIDQGDNNQ